MHISLSILPTIEKRPYFEHVVFVDQLDHFSPIEVVYKCAFTPAYKGASTVRGFWAYWHKYKNTSK